MKKSFQLIEFPFEVRGYTFNKLNLNGTRNYIAK